MEENISYANGKKELIYTYLFQMICTFHDSFFFSGKTNERTDRHVFVRNRQGRFYFIQIFV